MPRSGPPKNPEECACFVMRRAGRVLSQAYDAALRPAGIRGTQFSVLSVVSESGPIRVSDLSRVLATDQTTMTRNVQVLERSGLVRVREGDDGRTREVGITAAGRRAFDRAIVLWNEVQERLAERVGEAELDELLRAVSAVTREFEAH